MARPKPKTNRQLPDAVRCDGSYAGHYQEPAIAARYRSLVLGYAAEQRMGSAKYWASAQGPDSPQALAKKTTGTGYASPLIRG